MKLVSAIAALALTGGAAFVLAGPNSAGASGMCTPEVTADGSVLYAQVYDAKPIRQKPPHIKALLPKRTLGAKMYLYAQKGMTKEYLQRAAMCHMSGDTPAYEQDPLRVDGIKSLRVYPSGGAFVISVSAKDQKTGKEIWKRAETLTTQIDSAAADRKASTDL